MEFVLTAFTCMLAIVTQAAMAYEPLAYTVYTETIWTTCPAAPLTTQVPFGVAALTGVTVHPPSSPTSCYSLPTAVSALTPVALPLNQILQDTSTSGPSDPVFFYLGKNGTLPHYLGTFIGGSQSLLDLSEEASRSGRLAITIPGGSSLVVDRSGFHLFSPHCLSVTSLNVASFWAQMVNLTTTPVTPPTTPQLLGKRAIQDEAAFVVQVRVEKNSETLQPSVVFGQSPCDLQGTTPGPNFDTMIYSCPYPGTNSTEKQCERAFTAWLGTSPIDSTGAPRNLSDFLNLISPFLAQSGSGVAALLPQTDNLNDIISQSLQWVGTTAQAVANQAIELGGLSLCAALHATDEYELAFRNSAVTHTIGAFVQLPTDTFVMDLVSLKPAPTQEPPRAQQPGMTDFPVVTGQSFLPVEWTQLEPLPGPVNSMPPRVQQSEAPSSFTMGSRWR
jgi:hypothetical protein